MATHEVRFGAPYEIRYVAQPDEDLVFVNYMHPSHLLDKERRKTVNSAKNKAHNRNLRHKNLRQPQSLDLNLIGRAQSAVDAWEDREGSQPTGLVVRGGSVRGRKWPIMTLNHSIGGLRNDPFNTFPIPVEGCVAHAVDYYIQCWCPSQFPVHTTLTAPNTFISKLFPLALQNVELFEALVVMSQCYYTANYEAETSVSLEVLKHRGSAIVNLRKKLLSHSGYADDAVMMTMLVMITTDYLLGDNQAFKIHLNAIHNILKVFNDQCHDSDHVLHGLRRVMLRQFEYYWQVIIDQELGLSSTDRSWELKISYPTYPYSPEICYSISTMSPGFRAIALTGSLSVQVIRYLEHVSVYSIYLGNVRLGIATEEEKQYLLNYGPSQYQESEDADLVRKLGIRSRHVGPYGTHIEQCIALALTLWNLIAFNKTRLSPMYRQLVQQLASTIKQVGFELRLKWEQKWEQGQKSMSELELAVSELQIWVAIVIAGACRGVKALTMLGDQVMDDLLRRHDEARGWQRLEVILSKFFQHDALAKEWRICWQEGTRRRARRELLLP